MSLGHINPIYGSLVLEGEPDLDFVVDSPLPLVWQRSFVSDNPDTGWLGRGWTLPLSFRVEVEARGLTFIDAQGRRIRFPMLAVGASFFSPYEHTTLSRPDTNRVELLTPDGLRLVFAPGPQQSADVQARAQAEADEQAAFEAALRQSDAPGPDDAQGPDDTPAAPIHRPPQADTLPLLGLIDRNGHWLRIHRTPDGLPQVVEASDGRWTGLRFETLPAGPRLVEVLELIGGPDDHDRFAGSQRRVAYRYTDAGELSEVLDADGSTVRAFRWAGGHLVAQSEPDGLAMDYRYDGPAPTGRVVESRSSLGAVERFAYDLAARRTRVTDGEGRTRVYDYDPDGHLTAFTGPDGATTTYLRDIHGNLLTLTDPLGRVTRHQYDAAGNLVRIQQPDGADWRLRHDPRLRQPVEVTDPLGQSSHFRYDARGNLVEARAADGAVTRYLLDDHGRPLRIRDARGGESVLAYDAAGRLLAHRDCVGSTTTFGYDRSGNLLTVTDAMGGVTRYAYQRINRRDRVVALTHPDGAVERFAYDRLGRLIAHHDPQGHATRYRLDPAGRPLVRENALGHTLAYRYDVHGRLLALTNENGAVYRFGWDAADRLVSERGFDARRIDYRYNAAGELIEAADGVPHAAAWMAPGHAGVLRTRFVRDAMGRLLEKHATRPGTGGQRRGRTRFGYSRTGALVLARNPQARVELGYTPSGQVAHETTRARDGRVARISHRYDGLGNRVETVLPDGRVLRPELYGSGHVSRIRLDGQLITEFERDALHRETVRTQGRLRSYFERDAVGRLVRQFVRPGGDGAPAPEPKIARHYHYDRAGQLLGIDDARSGRSLYRYDATGRLLAASGPLGEERFAFDPASNLLDPGQPPTAAPGEKRSWTTSEWADYVRAHIDDPGFNPLQGPGEAHEDPASWGEARPNRLLVYRDHRYRYDEWGNTVEKRSGGHRRMRLHWDADHQLRVVRIERGAGINRAANDAGPTARPESAVEVEHWAYDYDPFGRRIAKYPIDEARAQAWIEDGDEEALGVGLTQALKQAPEDKSQREPATTFAWDGNRLLAEHRAEVHQLYLYEPDSFVPLAIVRRIQAANADADTEADREDLPPAELVTLRDQYPEQWARVQARRQKLARQMGLPEEPKSAASEAKTEVFHVHVDHLGTPREITDSDGHLVWTATYKAWGEAVVHNPPRRMLRQVGNAITEVLEEQDRPLACNLRFQGQYSDAETKLHFNYFRHYDPCSGRYASQDPIGLKGGVNQYLYAANPTGWIDQLGLTARGTGACKSCNNCASDLPPGQLESRRGVVRRFRTEQDQIFYRVYSGDATAGSWLTATPPRSSAWAVEALALPPGNNADLVQRVLVPKGTLVERSRAAPMPEWGRTRGGAEQFQLLERIPLENFEKGAPCK